MDSHFRDLPDFQSSEAHLVTIPATVDFHPIEPCQPGSTSELRDVPSCQVNAEESERKPFFVLFNTL